MHQCVKLQDRAKLTSSRAPKKSPHAGDPNDPVAEKQHLFCSLNINSIIINLLYQVPNSQMFRSQSQLKQFNRSDSKASFT